MSQITEQPEQTWNYTPLPAPIPITEQVWPEGTRPLVCTRHMTYNHEKYIRDCIEGVLMQKTTFPVRVCIHDDASTDMTDEIIREYQGKYPNLIWAFHQKENTYRHPNRVEMRAKFMSWSDDAKYNALCEGDDYWTDDLKLQKQILYMEENLGCAITAHNCELIFQDVKEHRVFSRENVGIFELKDVLSNHFIPTNSIVYRVWPKKIINQKNSNNKNLLGSDRLLAMLCLLNGYGYMFPEKMGIKRKNPTGITQIRKFTRNEKILHEKALFGIVLNQAHLLEHKNIIQKKVNGILKRKLKHEIKELRFLKAISTSFSIMKSLLY